VFSHHCVQDQEDTDLIDVAVGPAAYSLDELIFVLRIPTTYVTGQRVCIYRGHRRRQRAGRKDRKKEKGTVHLILRAGMCSQPPQIDTRVRTTTSEQRSGNI